jgi:hypothetical protein
MSIGPVRDSGTTHATPKASIYPSGPHQIAKELQPVILADLSFPEPRRLVMRFRSPDRAIAAAKFFCPRFGADAELDRVRILNRLVTPAESEHGLGAIDGLLDRNVTVIDPELGLRELEEALASGHTRAEKLAAVERLHAEERKRDVPEVEDFPLAMEEETPTFAHLSNMLRFRSLRAFEHWKGRKVTLAQLIEEVLMRRAQEEQGTVSQPGPLFPFRRDLRPPAGHYVAKMCATPGKLATADGGFPSTCTATGPIECIGVPFDFPGPSPIVGTLP